MMVLVVEGRDSRARSNGPELWDCSHSGSGPAAGKRGCRLGDLELHQVSPKVLGLGGRIYK